MWTAVSAFSAYAEDAQLREVQECTRHLPTMERLYNIPAHWLAAIASTESGRYNPKLRMTVPWPWTINVGGKGYWFDSKQEAIAATRQLLMRGEKSIDVGCMQVNLMYHGTAFANLDQAFEPMYNIAYAAKFLRSNYDNLNSWTKATAAYHSMRAERGADYYRKVYKKWQQVVDRLNDSMYAMPAPQQTWSNNRLDQPKSFAFKEEPALQREPLPSFRVATPPGTPPQQRVRWNSITVSRGMPAEPQRPLVESYPMAIASNTQPDVMAPAMPPAAAVTPLDITEESPAAAVPQDTPPSRQYERGVLVIRANPAPVKPPVAPAQEAATAPQESAQNQNKGQFNPSPLLQPSTTNQGLAREELSSDGADTIKPHVVTPKFVF